MLFYEKPVLLTMECLPFEDTHHWCFKLVFDTPVSSNCLSLPNKWSTKRFFFCHMTCQVTQAGRWVFHLKVNCMHFLFIFLVASPSWMTSPHSQAGWLWWGSNLFQICGPLSLSVESLSIKKNHVTLLSMQLFECCKCLRSTGFT